ncbi:MAG: hypothetical protein ABI162_07785 [Luteolibacter sp.]
MAKFPLLAILALGTFAPLKRASADAVSPATGLVRHSLLFTGEWDYHPDLGPASSFQLLDDRVVAETGGLQQ